MIEGLNVDGKEIKVEDLFKNAFASKILEQPPIHVVKWDKEDRNHAIGLYLLVTQNREFFKDVETFKSKINDDDIIIIDNNQLVTCIGAIDGMYSLIDGTIITQSYVRDRMVNFLLDNIGNRPMKYSTFKEYISTVKIGYFRDYIDENCNLDADTINNIENYILYVIDNIWYLPYSVLDGIANESIRKFKGENKNEGNDKASK